MGTSGSASQTKYKHLRDRLLVENGIEFLPRFLYLLIHPRPPCFNLHGAIQIKAHVVSETKLYLQPLIKTKKARHR
jgi:hypothetical protein